MKLKMLKAIGEYLSTNGTKNDDAVRSSIALLNLPVEVVLYRMLSFSVEIFEYFFSGVNALILSVALMKKYSFAEV